MGFGVDAEMFLSMMPPDAGVTRSLDFRSYLPSSFSLLNFAHITNTLIRFFLYSSYDT